MLSTSYPLLDVFLTTLWIVGFILWIWIAIGVFADIFRSRDLSGWGKAAWIVLIFVLPLFGVLIYLIARGRKMRLHAVEDTTAADLATREYIRRVVATTDHSDELAKLTSLRDSGAITQAEFEEMSARLKDPKQPTPSPG
jgi:uncharacterized protein (DUF58 family)